MASDVKRGVLVVVVVVRVSNMRACPCLKSFEDKKEDANLGDL